MELQNSARTPIDGSTRGRGVVRRSSTAVGRAIVRPGGAGCACGAGCRPPPCRRDGREIPGAPVRGPRETRGRREERRAGSRRIGAPIDRCEPSAAERDDAQAEQPFPRRLPPEPPADDVVEAGDHGAADEHQLPEAERGRESAEGVLREQEQRYGRPQSRRQMIMSATMAAGRVTNPARWPVATTTAVIVFACFGHRRTGGPRSVRPGRRRARSARAARPWRSPRSPRSAPGWRP